MGVLKPDMLTRVSEYTDKIVSYIQQVRVVFPKSRLPVFPHKTDTFFYWYQPWSFCTAVTCFTGI